MLCFCCCSGLHASLLLTSMQHWRCEITYTSSADITSADTTATTSQLSEIIASSTAVVRPCANASPLSMTALQVYCQAHTTALFFNIKLNITQGSLCPCSRDIESDLSRVTVPTLQLLSGCVLRAACASAAVTLRVLTKQKDGHAVRMTPQEAAPQVFHAMFSQVRFLCRF